MSVLRQSNWLGQARVDVSHLRMIDSSVAADFDVVVGRGIAGGKALIARGFSLTNITAGTLASNVQLIAADGIVYNVNASESGSFLWIPSDRPVEQLSSSNSRVTGSFTANTVNYVGIDFKRTANGLTTDLVQFIDPITEAENGRNVPLGRTLDYVIFITTVPFSASPNVTPIAKITTDINNAVVSVTDARPMMFRLGSGGDFSNSQNSYPWPFGRQENTVATSFTGGDKSILSNKDWFDALMTRVWELGGGENWYSPTADRNVQLIRRPSPAVFSTGDNFEISTGNLHWQGLRIAFDNSNTASVFYNDIADSTTDDANLNLMIDGCCWYVDIDRTANRSSGTALVMKRTQLQTLSAPTTPGSRWVVAWCMLLDGTLRVFSRDNPYFVGVNYQVATTTSTGSVKLSRAASTPGAPIVIADTGGTIAASAAIGLIVTGGSTHGILTTGQLAGHGILATGGATNGKGILAQGTGSGVGGDFTGGASGGGGIVAVGGGGDADGVTGTGTGTFSGIVGYGAATTVGRGGYFVGGSGGGDGLESIGGLTLSGSTGKGARLTGGAGSGVSITGGAGALISGGAGSAPNGNGGMGLFSLGAAGTGSGTGGAGATIIGGAGGGSGIIAAGNAAGDGISVTHSSTTTGFALKVGAPFIKLNGTDPVIGYNISNVVTPKNVCKAWATIVTDGAGNATVVDGFNISALAITDANANLQVTFGVAFANTNYCASLVGVSGANPVILKQAAVAVGSFKIGGVVLSAGPTMTDITWHNAIYTVYVSFYGAQA